MSVTSENPRLQVKGAFEFPYHPRHYTCWDVIFHGFVRFWLMQIKDGQECMDRGSLVGGLVG